MVRPLVQEYYLWSNNQIVAMPKYHLLNKTYEYIRVSSPRYSHLVQVGECDVPNENVYSKWRIKK